MTTSTHVQNERLALRIDLNSAEPFAQSEAANRTIRADDAGLRRRTNHWTGWGKRAKVTPRRT